MDVGGKKPRAFSPKLDVSMDSVWALGENDGMVPKVAFIVGMTGRGNAYLLSFFSSDLGFLRGRYL